MERQRKVLVIDDDEFALRSIAKVLEDESYRVVTVASGPEALDLLQQDSFDLILADLKMPGIDGLEVLRQTREIAPQAVVLILTAYASLESAIEALRAGAYDYLLKPCSTDELRLKIEKGLERVHLAEERQRAEETLRESEGRYRLLAENVTDVIWTMDTNGRYTYFSPSVTRLRGYSVEEAMTQTVEEVLTPASLEIALKALAEELATEEMEQKDLSRARALELELNCKDGSTVWTEAKITALRDPDGQAVGILGVTRDITEHKRAEEELHRSLEETARGQRTLLALSQAAQAVQRARTPDEVYRTVGDEVAKLGYHAMVFALTDDQAHLRIPYMTFEPALLRAAEKLTGLSAPDFRFPLLPGGFFQRIIAEKESTFLESSREVVAEVLPRPLRRLADRLLGMLGGEEAIYSRLMVGGETHGLLVVTGAGLTEADAPAVTAFANQAAIVIHNAQLFEAERAARERLRDLAGYLEATREEERTHIAREIHDEFGQTLTALKMDLAWLTKRLPVDRPRLVEKANTMSDLIASIFQTVRRIATDLRPGLLDNLGLVAAIEWQAQEFAERAGFDCELLLGDEEIVLNPDLATAIFRIFQETLTNIARHAEATQVRVELEERPEKLVLIVQDNGSGITKSQASDSKSLGLIGMQERARSWGGDVTFRGVPGQGTTVTVQVPRASAKEERK